MAQPQANEYDMSKLSSLHNQLSTLKHTRATVRLVTAFAALASAILWVLIGLFVLDVLFELPILPRLIMMVIGAAVSFWAFTKFTQPLLGVSESELDMALMVERQQKIDSDLVAALQFETPEAADWGSRQLETAVINYVSEFGRGLNVFEGFSREQMLRRAAILGATALVVVAFVLVAPTYASVFVNRLLLGSRHYPTKTKIVQLRVNDAIVLSRGETSALPETVKAAQGQSMLFYAQCAGVLPEAGVLRVRPAGGGTARRVDMKPLTLDQRLAMLTAAQSRVEEAIAKDEIDISGPWKQEVAGLATFDAPDASAKIEKLKEDRTALVAILADVQKSIANWPKGADATAVFHGDMGRLVDEVRYSLTLGDAWTDAALVKMIPLPVVELVPEIVPPKYARGRDEEKSTSRQLSVLEGSEVRFTLKCVNNKRLKEAWLIAKGKEAAKKYPLVKSDKTGMEWKVPAGSPLEKVREELRYELQVTDEDDLHLETPIRGIIRLRIDRPPGGTAEVVHRVVLPAAKPNISYRLTDDYGISKLVLNVDVERNPETLGTPEPGEEKKPAEDMKKSFVLFEGTEAKPAILTPEPVRGNYEFNLSPLMLAKGDHIRLTLEITDYRGDAPGQVYLSDPLILEISDESGVLAAISEADERSEQRLTDIIKKQLGIGESP
jgi:hypothetical protein